MASSKAERKLNRIITLMGPTASGKTDLAIALCQEFPAEIINVDSALVYRSLNIGAAKPSQAELELAPHHLIDIRDPAEPYSAADFCIDAEKAIREIVSRGKTPLLVGGTMMYFKALLEGLSDMPVADKDVRDEIEKEANEKSWAYIHQKLAEVDPQSAERIHPNHSQRLSRALEVFRVTGRTMTELRAKEKKGLLEQFDWCQLAIAPRDRAVLHQRIEQRFDLMLAKGLVEEVSGLYRRGDLSANLPAMRAVGYRQVWEYLDGDITYDRMRDKGLAATRQLAKRQITWLRSWPSLNWIYTQSETGEMLTSYEILQQALNFLGKRSI